MNTRLVITSVALLAVTTTASAQGVNGIDQDPFYPLTPAAKEPGKTRAEVRAELEQAWRDGTLVRNVETGYPGAPVAMGTRSREAVRAEALQASHSGQMRGDVN